MASTDSTYYYSGSDMGSWISYFRVDLEFDLDPSLGLNNHRHFYLFSFLFRFFVPGSSKIKLSCFLSKKKSRIITKALLIFLIYFHLSVSVPWFYYTHLSLQWFRLLATELSPRIINLLSDFRRLDILEKFFLLQYKYITNYFMLLSVK